MSGATQPRTKPHRDCHGTACLAMTSVSDKAILHNPYCLCERSEAISAEEVRGNEALTKIATALHVPRNDSGW